MEGQVYKVIKDHIPAFREPIILKKGDKVTVGREFTEDPDWPNWIECKNKEGMKGWVPKQYLKIDGKTGIALRSYSANELSEKAHSGWQQAEKTAPESSPNTAWNIHTGDLRKFKKIPALLNLQPNDPTFHYYDEV